MSEARALLNAGEHIVSNFEWYESRCLEGRAAGVADAKTALAMHNACGGDPSAPIYFSVDTDTTGPAVADYFAGINSVLGKARTGVYGSYKVCKWLIDNGYIGKVRDGSNHYYAWQTYAWSYGAYDERCALSQDHNGATVAGADVDIDHSHSTDYGQWGYDGEDDGLATISQDDFNARMTGFLKNTDCRQLLVSAIFRTDKVLAAPASELTPTTDNTEWWGVSFLQITIDKINQVLAELAAEKAPTVNVDQDVLTAALTAAVANALAGQTYDVTPKKAA